MAPRTLSPRASRSSESESESAESESSARDSEHPGPPSQSQAQCRTAALTGRGLSLRLRLRLRLTGSAESAHSSASGYLSNVLQNVNTTLHNSHSVTLPVTCTATVPPSHTSTTAVLTAPGSLPSRLTVRALLSPLQGGAGRKERKGGQGGREERVRAS